jgi:hypothetical protein
LSREPFIRLTWHQALGDSPLSFNFLAIFSAVQVQRNSCHKDSSCSRSMNSMVRLSLGKPRHCSIQPEEEPVHRRIIGQLALDILHHDAHTLKSLLSHVLCLPHADRRLDSASVW